MAAHGNKTLLPVTAHMRKPFIDLIRSAHACSYWLRLHNSMLGPRPAMIMTPFHAFLCTFFFINSVAKQKEIFKKGYLQINKFWTGSIFSCKGEKILFDKPSPFQVSNFKFQEHHKSIYMRKFDCFRISIYKLFYF